MFIFLRPSLYETVFARRTKNRVPSRVATPITHQKVLSTAITAHPKASPTDRVSTKIYNLFVRAAVVYSGAPKVLMFGAKFAIKRM